MPGSAEGVVYTRDPANGGLDVLHVIVTSGLGKGVVDGTGDTELIRLQRRFSHVSVDDGATTSLRSFAGGAASSMTEELLSRLATVALKIEAAFGEPQDIEWAFDDNNKLFILQSRPLQIDDHEAGPSPVVSAEEEAGEPPLLAETLDHYGFRVELHTDALLARLKKRPADYLETRLQVLGYLILHSRQLDMIMDQVGSFERYRDKFYTEIDSMFAEAPLHAMEDH